MIIIIMIRTTLDRVLFICLGLAALLLAATSWDPGGAGPDKVNDDVDDNVNDDDDDDDDDDDNHHDDNGNAYDDN